MKWKRQASRVYGKGQSYNCHNIVTAQQLQNTLNQYETITQTQKETEEKFDKITKQLIQLQMSLKIIEHEIQELVKQ